MKIVSVLKQPFFLLFLIITFLFLLLQPSLRSSVFAQSRSTAWNQFIVQLADKKRMDTKAFWQLREFYGPGSFVFKREGIPQSKQPAFVSAIQVPSAMKDKSLSFLQYDSQYFSSMDSLVTSQNASLFSEVISSLSKKYRVIAKGENYIIVEKTPREAFIVFLANGEEMEKANGFFDYHEKDIKLVKGKSWLDISSIVTK